MPVIYGFLERITYYNEENDFLVAKLQEKGKKDLTTIVGNLSGINAGESLKLTGRWVHNKKFGEQFQVETFEVKDYISNIGNVAAEEGHVVKLKN